MAHKEHLKIVINNTFQSLSATYSNQIEGGFNPCGATRLVIPRKSVQSGGAIRISEQELRFVFVEELIKYLATDQGKDWDVYYSVETPTAHNYSFPKSGPIHHGNKKEGRSGNIDLTIHDNTGRRVALIEFKHGHDEHAMNKDFLKLAKEPEVQLRYFIGLLSASTESTKSRIENPKKESYIDSNNTILIYYSLAHNGATGVVLGEQHIKE